MIPVIAFAGRTNAGKTTVLERVVAALRQRGYRVGVVKHSHHAVEMDTPNTDTWRLAQAGGEPVAIASQQKVWLAASLAGGGPEGIVERWMGDVDIVLCEGYKQSALPKVEVYRSALGGDFLCKPDEMVALVTDKRFPGDVPQFPPDDVSELVRLIEDKYLHPAQAADGVDLFADGRRIPLGEFAQQIIARTLLGMASSLKGVGAPVRMEFRVRLRREKA